MKKRPGAYVAFYEGDKVLLIRRTPEYSVGYSYIGGGIEEGETPEEALIREVSEEVCYDSEIEDYEFVKRLDFEIERDGEPLGIEAYFYVSELKDKLEKFTLTDTANESGEKCTLELIKIEDVKESDMHWSGFEFLKAAEEYITNKN